MVLLLFHENSLSNLFCQEPCVYFKILKHDIKQTVVTSRTFEEYCAYLRKEIAALLFLFYKTSCSNFYLKGTVKYSHSFKINMLI